MMTAINPQVLMVALLAAVSIGGIAWVFLYPILSGERQMERRQESLAKPQSAAARVSGARGPQKSRREQVEETLKEIEIRNSKAKKIPLNMKIAQAGLSWSKRQFIMLSATLGLVTFVVVMFTGLGWLVAAALAFAASFGLPRWILNFLKKRRQQRFLLAFPDAVDVIVRGIKAGLPLLDSLKIVALEAPEPVKSEFRQIVETQTVGIPLGDACIKLYDRMPLPEASFFGIVVSIQQKAGGNLSEALGNLSRVLRDRKRMQAKIKAMSMEAKASATIIAALPFAVMLLVYITSPRYIELLWTQPVGRMMLAACVVWMSMGVLVMKKMINFDF